MEQVLKVLSNNDFLGRTLSLEIDLPAEIIKEQLDRFNLENVGICYDTGNRMGLRVDLRQEIKTLSNHINHVHIKYKEQGKNVRIKNNSEELKQAFEALKEISYASSLILETCIAPIPEKEARSNLSAIKNYML